MLLRFKKEQLEAALESRRDWARKLDAKNRKKHVVDEKAYLERFRSKLKAALKWDYEQAKANRFEVELGYHEQRQKPKCPEGVEAALDKYIAQVAMDGRERYVLSPHSPKRWDAFDTSELYWLLTHDESAKADICEV